jgi:hypothetical protein
MVRTFVSFIAAVTVIVAAMGFVFSGTVPGEAASASPWCLRVVTGGLSVDQCQYRTFEACDMERANESNASSCIRNPANLIQENPQRMRRGVAQ